MPLLSVSRYIAITRIRNQTFKVSSLKPIVPVTVFCNVLLSPKQLKLYSRNFNGETKLRVCTGIFIDSGYHSACFLQIKILRGFMLSVKNSSVKQ